jgi:alkanesulfonate monooxygenase SsuD/methylene tetrahydromethanopterin reductase-like flavin-dependent oxidoreductase (luciferase family)
VKFGLLVSNVGTYGDPRATVKLARAAEDAGWDAVLVWDHLGFVWNGAAADPWVTLGAVAAKTERIVVGTGVTPVARRRPHVLANEIATLERLSGGRVVFGAGLGGGHGEFARFGEDEDDKARAELLDEGLEVIRTLLDGEVVQHRGTHFTVEGVQLQPPPERRVPIWIGGLGRRARARAARFNGWFADTADKKEVTTTPDELAALLDGYTFGDVAFLGYSDAGDRSLHDAYARAGATWWIEQVHDGRGDAEAMLTRVRSGP